MYLAGYHVSDHGKDRRLMANSSRCFRPEGTFNRCGMFFVLLLVLVLDKGVQV